MQSSQVRVPVSTLIFFFYFIRKHVRPQSINKIFIYMSQHLMLSLWLSGSMSEL